MIHEVRDMKIGVRGLTRGELKKLEEDGIDIGEISEIEDQEKRYAVMDRVLGMAAPECNPEDLTPAESMEFIIVVVRLTYLGEGEIKKFIESQKTGLEDASGTAAPAPKKASRTKDAAQS